MAIDSFGRHVLQLEVGGDMGHGSRPQDIKHHAIFAAFAILKDLRTLLSGTQVNLIAISTGTRNSPNQFPSMCSLKLEVESDDTPPLQKVDNFIASLDRVTRVQ